MPTITKAVRDAIGLAPAEEPRFWPDTESLSTPASLAYCRTAEAWLFCGGDAASPISILYGPPDEGFTWQSTGEQFADYGCRWDRVIAAYDK